MEELGLGSSPKIGDLKQGKEIDWEGETIKPEQVIQQVQGRKVVYSGDTAKCQKTLDAKKTPICLFMKPHVCMI